MSSRSRLSRRLENKTKKSFLLSLIAIIFLVFILLKFGVPALINLTLFMSGSKNAQELKQKEQNNYIAPPILDPLTTATNSAEINVSGKADKDQTINLYINDELYDKTKTKDDGSFSFKNVDLSKGENNISAKAITEDKKQSDYSQRYTINYKSDAPKLEINEPSDGKNFSKDENQTIVSGSTDPGNKVTVNDYWAIVDSSGKFTYRLKLQDGENKIKVISEDEAGNRSEKEIKVNYSS